MGKKYTKYKNFLEKFLDSNHGKRTFNIIYSVGAAIVIIGAMAKILHWPFGNQMLMIGMITEAIVFLVSAFEKPSKEYKWEEVYPVLAEDEDFAPRTERVEPIQSSSVHQNPTIQTSPSVRNTSEPESSYNPSQASPGVSNNLHKNEVYGGNRNSSVSQESNIPTDGSFGGSQLSGNITIVSGGGGSTSNTGLSSIPEDGVEYLAKMAGNMDQFSKATESLMKVSESLEKSFSAITQNADGIGSNTQNYVTQMEALNRNIAGLNTIYEIQLKGISGQIGTIEHINAGLDRIKKLYDGSLADSSIFKHETEKMAQQLAELNQVYSRLLQAMTSNMN